VTDSVLRSHCMSSPWSSLRRVTLSPCRDEFLMYSNWLSCHRSVAATQANANERRCISRSHTVLSPPLVSHFLPHSRFRVLTCYMCLRLTAPTCDRRDQQLVSMKCIGRLETTVGHLVGPSDPNIVDSPTYGRPSYWAPKVRSQTSEYLWFK
jgi:hypothetical protein